MQIEQVPLFQSLPGREIHFLAQTMRPLELEPGVILCREGDHGDTFFVILSGEVEIIKSLGMKSEQVLGVRGPSDFFGEMSLLIPDGLRTASVRTRTPVKLMVLNRMDFDDLLQRRPLLSYEMVRVLSLRLQESNNDTYAVWAEWLLLAAKHGATIASTEVNWLAWEDPFWERTDAQELKCAQENDPLQVIKRIQMHAPLSLLMGEDRFRDITVRREKL